ncbi:MAG: fasciclin domain-containing protein [Desulfomonilia bacterium]
MERHLRTVRLCLFGALCLLIIIILSVSSPASETERDDLVNTMENICSLKTFTAAVRTAEIEYILGKEGPFTVFAPSDDAFRNLPHETMEMIFNPENREELNALIAYHVAPEMIPSSELKEDFMFTALNEEVLTITVREGAFFVNNSRISRADILCTNGIIHIIESVILNGD